MARLTNMEPVEGGYCRKCRPDLFPVESVDPERNYYEGHIAVRFGDGQWFQAYLDGENVSVMCSEAFAGENGWVVMYWEQDGRKWRCLCGKGAVEAVHHGDVRIERNNGP